MVSNLQVLNKMARFDEETNGTFTQTWFSREGMADDIVYFPSSTYGIDANRTFEWVFYQLYLVYNHSYDIMELYSCKKSVAF